MNMPKVEFIYDKDCPNVEGARENLLRAFARVGLSPRWTEWERNSSETPEYARGYGSPTVLIDGKDCLGTSPELGVNSCRVYDGTEGSLIGVPPIEVIASRLRQNSTSNGTTGSSKRRARWFSGAAVIPGIGVAFLPKLACPACWPAYAGVLSSLGLGFLVESRYLLVLTTVFLIAALGALAFRASSRRGFGPFGLGLVASVMILFGKFALESDVTMYVGVGILVSASLWNSWPRGAVKNGSCPSCVGAEPIRK